MRYRARHILEYVMLRGVLGMAAVVPYRMALVIGWVAARVSGLFLGAKMRETAARVRRVLGVDERESMRIARRAWLQLCWGVVEGMRTPRMTTEWIRKIVDLRDFHMISDNMKEGRGMVLAVPHMGNWELAGVTCQRLGVQLMIIVRTQKNPLSDRYLRELRAKAGFESYERESTAFAGIVRGLREGKVLAILPDLRAKGGSYRCRYLGAETEIPNGMARFAREAGVPIVPAFAFREGWGRHVLRGFDPIQPDLSLDREEDGRRMTQYVMDCFDRAVREHPDQYFWFNKRWVLGREQPPVNRPST